MVAYTFNPNTQETEFKARLVYIASFRPAGATGRPYLKRLKNKKKN